VTGDPTMGSLLRDLAPQALAIVSRRHASFADAEDAVQDALIKATSTWPETGTPEHPLA
jgi:predicted RNA polymerase sigma factor